MKWIAIAAVMSLAACAEAEPPADAAERPPGSAATEGAETAPASELSETSPTLQPMVFDEFSTVVEPGLGCGFSADEQTLFVATADPRDEVRAEGAVKLDGRLVLVTRTEAGGYDALAEGGSFRGDGGLTIGIVRAPGEGTPSRTETRAWDATLTVMHDGGRAELAGTWDCGA